LRIKVTAFPPGNGYCINPNSGSHLLLGQAELNPRFQMGLSGSPFEAAIWQMVVVSDFATLTARKCSWQLVNVAGQPESNRL
jgi:hypothetical protein